MEDPVRVTTIMDVPYKTLYCEALSFGGTAKSAGTVKGVGTTRFNTVITSLAASRDV